MAIDSHNAVILYNAHSDHAKDLAEALASALGTRHSLSSTTDGEVDLASIGGDVLVTVGGDGTLLRAIGTLLGGRRRSRIPACST